MTSLRSSCTFSTAVRLNRARTRRTTSPASLPSLTIRSAASTALGTLGGDADKPSHAGVSVGDDGCERLIDFVSNRAGQLADRGDLGRACHPGLKIADRLGRAFQLGGRQPVLRHVHRRTDELNEIAGIVGHRLARRVLIPDASIRKDDSIASPILGLLVHAPLELRLNTRTVFRVNPVEPERRSRDVLTRLHGVRALNLRRTLDEVRCQIVSPASSTTEPLHLEQKGLASPQRIFGDLSVVDVGPDAIPASWPS